MKIYWHKEYGGASVELLVYKREKVWYAFSHHFDNFYIKVELDVL